MTDFGDDFEDVQVHEAGDASAELDALAYAGGTDIHVDAGGGYGDELLGHELAHVVQQDAGDPAAEIDGD